MNSTFTCIRCGWGYDHNTGEPDERMCNECIKEEDDKLHDDTQYFLRRQESYRMMKETELNEMRENL